MIPVFTKANTSRHKCFAFMFLMLFSLFAKGQEPLFYTETIPTPSGCSDSIYHQILLWSTDRIKENNRNEMVVYNHFNDKGIVLLKLCQEFRIAGAAKDIADKISNMPIVGKKVKGITDYTNLGIDGYISCFFTIEVEEGHVTVKQERFCHTAYSGQSSASQGLLYKDTDDNVIATVTDILNKGQYKAMQAAALPQCEEWWKQTTSTLKARIQ